MTQHRFEILTRVCVGCDLDQSVAFEQSLDKRRKNRGCPADYVTIETASGIVEVVSASDRVILRMDGGDLVRFDAEGARALIHAAGGSC